MEKQKNTNACTADGELDSLNGLLHSQELDFEMWEAFTLDVASSKYDREGVTRRLRELT